MRRIAVLGTLLLMASWFMVSCGSGGRPSAPDLSPGASKSASAPPENQGEYDLPEQKIDALIKEMTLEEKVGQMLFLAYRTNAHGERALSMDDALRENLSSYKPGGFVLFSDNLESIDQTVFFIQQLQACSRIPLFISVDEEGGIVSRLNRAPDLHSTVMPDPYTIGLTGNSEYAYSAARAIADELLSLGFNMDFAPVADIYSNPENTVIGKRAYGTEPQLVSSMVREAVAGFMDGQIVPVLKHFPGHGDTVADTHTGAASVDHDLERLLTFELLPFQEGIAAGADAVMVAHILLPNVTADPVPATLSKEVVTGLLREKLGFDGVIITDAMEMSAVSAYYDDDEAAVMAVTAGVDMLLIPQSPEKAYHAILTAVEQGLVSEERIDESVYRILRLKDKYGILDNRIQRPDPEKTLGRPEHTALANAIREAAARK